MTTIVALSCGAVLIAAASIHIYWGFGGRRGFAVAVPQRPDGLPIFVPGPFSCHAVGGLLLVVASILASLAGAVPVASDQTWLILAGAGCAGVFLLRGLAWHRYVGLLKQVRTTDFGRYDTILYSPLCLLLAAGFAYLTFQYGNA